MAPVACVGVSVNFKEVSTSSFTPFAVQIEVITRDELYALTKAVGTMCNGHGLDLYDYLIAKCQEFGVKL